MALRIAGRSRLLHNPPGELRIAGRSRLLQITAFHSPWPPGPGTPCPDRRSPRHRHLGRRDRRREVHRRRPGGRLRCRESLRCAARRAPSILAGIFPWLRACGSRSGELEAKPAETCER